MAVFTRHRLEKTMKITEEPPYLGVALKTKKSG
jgi:hypothetical protein